MKDKKTLRNEIAKEADELHAKIGRLIKFLLSEEGSEVTYNTRSIMKQQLKAMKEYEDALVERGILFQHDIHAKNVQDGILAKNTLEHYLNADNE